MVVRNRPNADGRIRSSLAVKKAVDRQTSPGALGSTTTQILKQAATVAGKRKVACPKVFQGVLWAFWIGCLVGAL